VGKYPGLDQQLFDNLNSPGYYSIYPPFGQIIAYLATWHPTDNYILESIIFKTFMFISEIGSMLFIYKVISLLGMNIDRIIVYALNPLIIIEIMGNIHFEGFMIFFLSASLFFLFKNRSLLTSSALSLSIASKLLPLMFVPIYFLKVSKSTRKWFLLTLTLFLVIFFGPFLFDNQIISNFSDSIDLYVKKFEFNGSIYYLLRSFGYYIKGFNLIHIIGPILSIATVILILLLALFFKKSETKSDGDFISVLLFSFTIYLLLATTVHPWYLCVPILLSLFTRYSYPIYWSGLIFITYINYSYIPFYENYFVVIVEYIIVYYLIIKEINWRYVYEIWQGYKIKKAHDIES
jgi:hypothetical protein